MQDGGEEEGREGGGIGESIEIFGQAVLSVKKSDDFEICVEVVKNAHGKKEVSLCDLHCQQYSLVSCNTIIYINNR